MKITKDAARAARQMFRATIVDGRLDVQRAKVMVRKVIEKKPRNYFGILSAYQRLLRLEFEKSHAVVESATTLTPEINKQLVSGLKEKYGSDLTTEFRTNGALIGGLRVKVGSDVWDGSVLNKLDRLAAKL